MFDFECDFCHDEFMEAEMVFLCGDEEVSPEDDVDKQFCLSCYIFKTELEQLFG